MDTSAKIVASSPRDAFGSQMTLVQNDAGYWNASLMAAQGNRKWNTYYRSNQAQEFITRYMAELDVPETELVYYQEPTQRGQGGVTWVRRRLALHFLGGLSASFANWAFGVIERYIDGEITTEESKAAKKAMDRLLEEGRLKYEASQKRLKDAEKNLAITEGRLTTEKEYTRRMCGTVEEATSQVSRLEGDLKRAHKLVTNRDREKAKFAFVKRLREAVAAYARDRTVASPEAEEGFGFDKDGSPMTIPKFVQGLERGFNDYNGRTWDLFNEVPGHGWNIIPMTRPDHEKQSVEDFCLHDNFTAGYNHPDKKKTLLETGMDMHAADPPVSKRSRRY